MNCRIVGLLLAIMVASSCNYQKKLLEYKYFNDKLDSSHAVVMRSEALIEVDDRLAIKVSSLNNEASAPFNEQPALGYQVEKDGALLLPELGRINARGKTLIELRDTLLKVLTKFLTDPIVNINFLNAKVMMMGEVGHVGILTIPDGKLTILEAITQSGDIPFTGRKDKVMVIREEGGKRIFATVNVQSHNIYNSPYYFLKQNDIVYVEPTLQKIRQQSNSVFLTNASLITTTTALFFSLIGIYSYVVKK